MKLEEMKALVHQILDRARACRRETASMHPMTTIFVKGEFVVPMMYTILSDQDKLYVIKDINDKFDEVQPDAVLMVFEGYMLTKDFPPGTKEEKMRSSMEAEGRLRDHPESVDCLIVEGICPEGSYMLYESFTKRADGHLEFGGPVESPGGATNSRFIGGLYSKGRIKR